VLVVAASVHNAIEVTQQILQHLQIEIGKGRSAKRYAAAGTVGFFLSDPIYSARDEWRWGSEGRPLSAAWRSTNPQVRYQPPIELGATDTSPKAKQVALLNRLCNLGTIPPWWTPIFVRKVRPTRKTAEIAWCHDCIPQPSPLPTL
jgi:hypothetical protein